MIFNSYWSGFEVRGYIVVVIIEDLVDAEKLLSTVNLF
jgi:hypothetical protein